MFYICFANLVTTGLIGLLSIWAEASATKEWNFYFIFINLPMGLYVATLLESVVPG